MFRDVMVDYPFYLVAFGSVISTGYYALLHLILLKLNRTGM